MILPFKLSFIEEFPLPRLVTRGYLENGQAALKLTCCKFVRFCSTLACLNNKAWRFSARCGGRVKGGRKGEGGGKRKRGMRGSRERAEKRHLLHPERLFRAISINLHPFGIASNSNSLGNYTPIFGVYNIRS